MKRFLATGVVILAVGTLLAAPVPADTRKPAAFPAGQYVLGGSKEAARGEDVYEFTKTFRLKPGQYILSGGPKPTDLIVVDDDLEVIQDKTKLFVDDDQRPSTNIRGKNAARYQGQPLVLVLDPSKKMQIVATDHEAAEAIIGALWLHRWDGASKKLSSGKSATSTASLPFTFFDELFAIGDGFEMPEKVSTDAATDVPEKPATLLPRLQPAAPPAAPLVPVAFKEADAVAFVKAAVVDGLTEDGVAPALAAALAKRDDFVPKCAICAPTQQALTEHGKLKTAPVSKEGKRLPEELVKRLKTDTTATRQLALRELVQRYIDREYARRELTSDQKVALQKELEEMRKLAMGGLKEGQKFCPACDGACRFTPKL